MFDEMIASNVQRTTIRLAVQDELMHSTGTPL